ncbi:MAG: DUF5655 domain-containing protein [Saprospiraceae bacterium]
MWTCPNCQRTFKNENQAHGCHRIDKMDFFAKRPAFLWELYKKVVEGARAFGEFREEAVPPDVIFFKTKSTFLAVKVKKDHLDIAFFLDHVEDVPPMSKYLQTSKRRVVHIVPVDSAEEINVQLLEWMRASYELITNAQTGTINP